ncbi:hypothetical protein IP83_01605 [Novosphingobium sp. AAP93]|nr:hypothetical protein IP83_01605 [Novosphingobium sp. AAP93]
MYILVATVQAGTGRERQNLRAASEVLIMSLPPESLTKYSDQVDPGANFGEGSFLQERIAPTRPARTTTGIVFRKPDKTTWSGILTVAGLLIIDSGVPALLIGMESFTIGRLMSAGIIAVCLIIPQFRRNRNFKIVDFSGLAPFILLSMMFFISFISNVIIFDFGFKNFAPSFYMLLPALTFYAFRNLGISTGDVIWGFIFSALFVSVIIVLDSTFGLASLRQMRRMSVFGEFGNTERLVFLKNACVIAVVVVLANLLTRKKPVWGYVFYTALLVAIGFPVFATFESRFAIIVPLLSTALFVSTARLRASRRLVLYAMGLVVGIPGAWLALQKFIAPMLENDWETYAETNNVSIRVNSFTYYQQWFERSDYFGIGHMSTSPEMHNMISDVVQQAFNLNDLGIYASLFQYGIFGLALTLLMTIYLIAGFFRLGYSGHPRAPEMHILGCYVATSLIQVVPANFFTLQSNCIYGSILWYLLCRSQFEDREMVRQRLTLVRV